MQMMNKTTLFLSLTILLSGAQLDAAAKKNLVTSAASSLASAANSVATNAPGWGAQANAALSSAQATLAADEAAAQGFLASVAAKLPSAQSVKPVAAGVAVGALASQVWAGWKAAQEQAKLDDEDSTEVHAFFQKSDAKNPTAGEQRVAVAFDSIDHAQYVVALARVNKGATKTVCLSICGRPGCWIVSRSSQQTKK